MADRHGNDSNSLPSFIVHDNPKPAEFIARKLFTDFTVLAGTKIDAILAQDPIEKPLAKYLQRGEDVNFDQMLVALGSISEHCLPSLLRALIAWYHHQLNLDEFMQKNHCDHCEHCDHKQHHSSSQQAARNDIKDSNQSSSTIGNTSRDICHLHQQQDCQQTECLLSASDTNLASNCSTLRSQSSSHYYQRELAIEFIFCQALIEIFGQLSLHPGHEDLINHVEQIAFQHFKFREGEQNEPNITNIHMIADLYGEVIGVLAQTRFQSVRKKFMFELNELRSKELTTFTTQSIISLLMGMKFFRVKMAPIEEFEASFLFLQECANYFLEVRHKDIKHALAGLFVEILVPVAASVKNEVNVPCLKKFVDMLYPQTLDMCTKKKHALSLFPLVTCLLCVSQRSFFLANWHIFLSMCLSNLKNRHPKMCRVALESLYRLLWVYMIRIKCESNTVTQSRLHSIVNSLFPKGSKTVVPRDTPLNIFVKIIQFIAQERLDFAMKQIVFDLLSVERPIKIILTPERMNIALRAFLVVTDSLQQREGEPPMPRSVGVLPSGNTSRVRKTYLQKMLTEEAAKSIGIYQYYPHVRRSFNDILKALDVHFGRPLMLTTTHNMNKEPDDMISSEMKSKIDLFKTCVAAIPRLIPDGMSKQDLIDLLSRLTVHMDEEMRGYAYQSLQTLVADSNEWRADVVEGFTSFLTNEINDTFRPLVDNALRMLLQLLTNWKTAVTVTNSPPPSQRNGSADSNDSQQHPTSRHGQLAARKNKALYEMKILEREISVNKLERFFNVIQSVEGLALVILCSCRQPTRKLAAHILRECRQLNKYYNSMATTAAAAGDVSMANMLQQRESAKANGNHTLDEPVADVIDRVSRETAEACLPYLSANERQFITTSMVLDLQLMAERSGTCWTSATHSEQSDQPTTVTETISQQRAGRSSTNDWSVHLEHVASSSQTTRANPPPVNSTENVDSEHQHMNAWLAFMLGYLDHVANSCPATTLIAWSVVYKRLSSLFTHLEQTQTSDNRASLLLSRGSTSSLKRPSNLYQHSDTYMLYLDLWKSYLMFACRVAPSSVSNVLSQQQQASATSNNSNSTGGNAVGSVVSGLSNQSGSISGGHQPGSGTPATGTISSTSGSITKTAVQPLIHPSGSATVNSGHHLISATNSSTDTPSTGVTAGATTTSSSISAGTGVSAAGLSNTSTLSNLSSSSPDHSLLLNERSDTKSPQTRQVMASVLFKQVLTLLRSEQADVTRATIDGLAQVNENVLKDLMDELGLYVREAIDRKQENMRRRKRREMLRVHLGSLFELISERGVFGQATSMHMTTSDPSSSRRSSSNHHPSSNQSACILNETLVEYVDGIRLYLETESDKDTGQLVQTIKILFAKFINHLIKSFPLEMRSYLLSRDLRRSLFHLFANWNAGAFTHYEDCFSKAATIIHLNDPNTSSGNYDHRQHQQANNRLSLGSSSKTSNVASAAAASIESEGQRTSEFEIATLQAMSSILCSGPVFDSTILNEDSCIYPWLIHLMWSNSEELQDLGLKTLTLLLDYNPDTGNLFNWLIDCCYTKREQIADICFTALANIYSVRELSSDKYIALINVTLMNIGSLRPKVHHLATNLMRLLDERFLKLNSQQYSAMYTDEIPEERMGQNNMLSSSTICVGGGVASNIGNHNEQWCNQMDVSRRMAKLHPQLTMSMISEMTCRVQTATPSKCKSLLMSLIPWLTNMELVDDNLAPTQTVLDNLFHLTMTLSNQYPKEIEAIWAKLSIIGDHMQGYLTELMSTLETIVDNSNFNDYLSDEPNCALFFWIAVVMLETDYEHEFLLAMKLLHKVLHLLPLDEPECITRIEKNIKQMKWDGFPGVHALVLKGCTSATTYEASITVLNQLIPILDNPIVDLSNSANSFPYNVMAQLTYLLMHYDEPSPTCVHIAQQIASWCTEKSKKMDNLSTVMTLYSKRTFSKESLQWIKCVVKYLYDAYSHVFPNLISFLIEMLDKGPQQIQQHLISILYCVLNYVDLSSSAPEAINSDLVKLTNKYAEGPQWKDLLRIFKLIVSRSSSLTTPSLVSSNTSTLTTNGQPHVMLPSLMGSATADTISLASNASWATMDPFGGGSESLTSDLMSGGLNFGAGSSGGGGRRELPGRTMEFSLDIKSMPIIGTRYLIKEDKEEGSDADDSNQQNQPSSTTHHWRKPWLGQALIRERLVCLLTGCGQRIGLPKSPNVIFTQNSDVVDQPSSMAGSSTDDVSPSQNNDLSDGHDKLEATAADSCGEEEQCFTMFKDFDFLEYELESQEGDDQDNFNWGVRRRSLSRIGDTPDEITVTSEVSTNSQACTDSLVNENEYGRSESP